MGEFGLTRPPASEVPNRLLVSNEDAFSEGQGGWTPPKSGRGELDALQST